MRSVLERIVRERAADRCEYCQIPGKFSALPLVIDHIIARQHGGKTASGNLALCCGICNQHKSPNLAGWDSRTGELTRLFNPRVDRWREHFRWRGSRLLGLTPVGRVTIYVLAINHSDQISLRGPLMAEGVFRWG